MAQFCRLHLITMKPVTKVILIWILLLVGLRLLFLLPHGHYEPMGLINTSLQVLMCILSVQIARRSHGAQLFVYINFVFSFGFVALLQAGPFIGFGLFPIESYPNAPVFYNFYFNKLGLDFCILLVPVYIAFDYFIHKRSVWVKYGLSLAIVCSFLTLSFGQYVSNPASLYDEREYKTLQALSVIQSQWTTQNGTNPSDNQLTVEFLRNKTVPMNGTDLSSRLRDCKDMLPYLREGGSTSVFWKPINLVGIETNLLVLFTIATLLFSFYSRNRSYYTYIDKLLILLFFSSALEIFHTYGAIRSVSLDNYYMVFKIGQYFTVGVLLIMVYTFDLKLRFVLSPTGDYYERVMLESPTSLTRWRDEIDTIILKTFSRGRLPWSNIAFKEINKDNSKGVT